MDEMGVLRNSVVERCNSDVGVSAGSVMGM